MAICMAFEIGGTVRETIAGAFYNSIKAPEGSEFNFLLFIFLLSFSIIIYRLSGHALILPLCLRVWCTPETPYVIFSYSLRLFYCLARSKSILR